MQGPQPSITVNAPSHKHSLLVSNVPNREGVCLQWALFSVFDLAALSPGITHTLARIAKALRATFLCTL